MLVKLRHIDVGIARIDVAALRLSLRLALLRLCRLRRCGVRRLHRLRNGRFFFAFGFWRLCLSRRGFRCNYLCGLFGRSRRFGGGGARLIQRFFDIADLVILCDHVENQI